MSDQWVGGKGSKPREGDDTTEQDYNDIDWSEDSDEEE